MAIIGSPQQVFYDDLDDRLVPIAGIVEKEPDGQQPQESDDQEWQEYAFALVPQEGTGVKTGCVPPP